MKRLMVVAGLLAAAYLFIRPKTVPCPQCGGHGAPPRWEGNYQFARICATCGASATPDLPLAPEHPEQVVQGE